MTNTAHDHPLAASIVTRQRWDARYAGGELPWDTRITPPEVVAFWQQGHLPRHGLALDIGCGPGTNVAYLARLGLTAIGLEIAGAALLTARSRHPAPVIGAGRAHFVCTDACRLPFAGLNANYILDIGCFHSLPIELRAAYAAGVMDNLAPGGYYHLYAFDSFDPPPDMEQRGPLGMEPGEVAARLATLQLVDEVVARPDRRPCRWYLFQRPPLA